MQKTLLTAIFSAVLVLSGCAISTTTTNVLQDDTKFEDTKVDNLIDDIVSRRYVQRANNLFVLFDASSSATEDYPGVGYKANNEPTKLEVQREILHRMNKTIADSASALNLADFRTSIRSFGYGDCKGYSDRYTDLHQAPTIYAKEAFDTATETIKCSHGRSHIGKALIKNEEGTNPINELLGNDRDKSVDDDLVAAKGNISLVIISDISKGRLSRFADSLLPEYLNPSLGKDDEKAIKDLRQKYGNRLCVYNIWMDSSIKNKEESHEHGGKEQINENESETFTRQEMMYSVDNPAECGGPSVFTAERVAETDGLKDFMRAVLLKSPPPTPTVDCSQLDSDGDGVNDCDDKCPNTLKGTPVNRLGCWIVDVKFDNDRSVIKPQYFPLLDKLAVDITANFSSLKLEVQGHTSSTASAAYNLRLSERRANAVAEYLNKKIKGPHKLIPHGYGLTRPIDTNETESGRANNRRVQLEVLQ